MQQKQQIRKRSMMPVRNVSFIEGEPFISVIPVESGFTNKS